MKLETGNKVASASLPLPPQIFLSPTSVKGKEGHKEMEQFWGNASVCFPC